MRTRSKGLSVLAALAPVLLGLLACAGPVTKATPAAERKPDAENPVQRTVKELLANQAAGRVRTVQGLGYVTAPIAVPLANGEVTLLPSSPELEVALARIQRRWWTGRRRPLPYETFQAAFAALTAQRIAVGRAGGEGLIRFAPTDDTGKFSFTQVPEGRWLLVADMSSPVSTLLWALPVEVGEQDPPLQFLVDGSLLLEARKTQQNPPAAPAR